MNKFELCFLIRLENRIIDMEKDRKQFEAAANGKEEKLSAQMKELHTTIEGLRSQLEKSQKETEKFSQRAKKIQVPFILSG